MTVLNHRLKSLFILLSFFLSLSSQGNVNPFDLPLAKKKQQTESTLISEVTTIAPGQSFSLALKLVHPKGWHSYYKNPGVVGSVLKVDWQKPEGVKIEYQGWPTPHYSMSGGLNTIGYEGTVYHLYTVTTPADLQIGQELTLTAKANWQICDQNGCVPESDSPSITLEVKNETSSNSAVASEFATARAHYPKELKEPSITATEADKTITLRIPVTSGLKAEGLTLFDEDRQADAQSPHLATIEGDTLILKVPRNPGSSYVEAPQPLDHIKGILSDGETAIRFSAPLQGNTATAVQAPTKAADELIVDDTPEQLAEMAKLYRPEEKIKFVKLGETVKTTIWTALFGAFIGGMLLNLMPCVFPVLGLKVLGFVQQSGNEPKKIRLHGLAFTAGLVVAMWVLAGFILFLKISLGRDVNWGQQMGNPYFVGAIIILLFVLGLNMAGVFEIGSSLTSVGQGVQKKGYSGSFFSGVLTTLIATPCSGPFLGAAMSYTLAQTAPIALFLFTIFALGISLPYLVLSFAPKLINKLPKPGAWMETFKVTMSFALFATVAFFLKSFGAQTGVAGLSWLLMALVVIAMALYFFGHWGVPFRKPRIRLWAGKVLPLVIGASGLSMALTAAKKDPPQTALLHGWEAWKPGKVEYHRSKGRIVWVDYTADW